MAPRRQARTGDRPLHVPGLGIIRAIGREAPCGLFDCEADDAAEANLAASPHWVR